MPPKSTPTPRAESNAIAWPCRGAGPLTARSLHRLPFHSHVSPRGVTGGVPVVLRPPKRTLTPRAGSQAIAEPDRPGGGPAARSQLFPLSCQVSPVPEGVCGRAVALVATQEHHLSAGPVVGHLRRHAEG